MKVGIIGCGQIAPVHLSVLRSIPEVQVVGLCDSYLPAAGALAERFDVRRVYRSAEELLSEAAPDAVHVLTPPDTHANLVLKALSADAHVLVEKPMATSFADAKAMTLAAKEKGLSLCVDHNRLFDPVVEATKKLVQEGALGEVVAVETYQGIDRGRGGNKDRHVSSESAAAVYHHLIVHPLYLQVYFLKEIQELFVVGKRTGRFPSAFAEEIRILLEGQDALGYVNFSLDTQPCLNAMHVCGTEATLLVDFNTITLVKLRKPNLPRLLAKSWHNLAHAFQLASATASNTFSMLSGRLSLYPGIGRVIRGFYSSLANQAPVLVTPGEGLEVVRLMEEIRLKVGQDPPRLENVKRVAT